MKIGGGVTLCFHFVIVALVTSSVVQQELRDSSYRYLCTGEIHVNLKETWRVKAVGSPAHNSLCSKSVVVVKNEPS